MTNTLTTKDVWRFIFQSVRPFPMAIGTMVFMAIFWAIDLSLRPYILKIILNRLTENSAADVFSYLAVPIFLFISLAFLTTTISRVYGYYVEIKMIPRLRQQLAQGAFG